MTKEQAIERLIEQVNHNMDTFIGILGIVLAAFLYFQWRLSEKQIQKMKDSTKQELEDKYHFQETINKVDEYRKSLEELKKKIKNLNHSIDDNKRELNAVVQDREKELADSIAADTKLNLKQEIANAQIEKMKIESQAMLLTTMNNSSDTKVLADAIREKIDKLMKDKKFKSISSPLTTTYNILKKSNNKDAKGLADYLKDKYPIATFFIELDSI